MDPDANLKEQLEIIERRQNPSRADELTDILEDYARLAELAQAMHGWLSAGGFLPKLWSRE